MAANWTLSMLVSCISDWSYRMTHKNLSPVNSYQPSGCQWHSLIHSRNIYCLLTLCKTLRPQALGEKELSWSEMLQNVCPFPFLQTLSSWASKASTECHRFSRLPLLIQTWAQASCSESLSQVSFLKWRHERGRKCARAQSINLSPHTVSLPCYLLLPEITLSIYFFTCSLLV